jgi:leader peptidase (prepilin peptidase)/N-methyltransferase
MFEIIALLVIFAALITLLVLSIIDLREGLLPNEYVLAFAVLGAAFHLVTTFHFLSLEDMALGAFIGAAFLYIVRAVANKIYKQDALGLGDVKLMGAAGIWLGPYYVLLALTAGGLAGLLHGVGVVMKNKLPIKGLSLPAGPGFAVGIVAAAIIQLQGLEKVLWP